VTAAPPATEVPVQALFDGDFLSFLVVIESTDTITEACDKVAFGVVGRRIPARPDTDYVMHTEDGTALPGELTVAQAGIEPDDFIRVGFADTRGYFEL
jgi:hypothetical protein